jgi:CBS domain containing-hemolysin-like protein
MVVQSNEAEIHGTRGRDMTTVLIISSTIAIVVSFLCSLAEALLLSLNPLTISRLQKQRPHAAESWKRLKRNISYPITAILVLNTIAHTGGATVAGGAFAEIFGEHRIWIFSVGFTIIVLLGTEILPKIIGVTFRDQLAPIAGPVLEGITILMRPFIVLSEFLFRRLLSKRESEQITTADLITLATLARSGRVIGLEQENIIVNAIRFSHTLVTRAMIPVKRVSFIRQGDTPESILALARAVEHSRYPVSRSQDAKDIYAYVHFRRAIPVSRDELARLIADAKPIRTVLELDTLMTALRLILQNKEHLLAVVNPQRHCVGIITLEDIAGELLGTDIESFE